MSLPVTVYTPESPLKHPVALVRALRRDLLAGRELAWRLFIRDLSAQYRQTYLGYIWVFLPPLVASATFIYLNSQGIVNIKDTGVPYPAFAMIGTLLWQTFVDAIQCPLQAVNAGKSMLAKINFPREALLLGGLYMVFFNLVIRLILVVAVMVFWKIGPGPGLVLFPVALAGLVLAGFAVGMAVLPLGALYGDFGRGIAIITQFWMLLTPVVYPLKPTGMAAFLGTWNPISPLIMVARESLCDRPITSLVAFAVVGLIAAMTAFLGLLAYRLVMPLLVERMGV